MAKPNDEQIKCEHEWKGTHGLFKTYYDCIKCNVKKEDWDCYIANPEKFNNEPKEHKTLSNYTDGSSVFGEDISSLQDHLNDLHKQIIEKSAKDYQEKLLEEFEEMLENQRF